MKQIKLGEKTYSLDRVILIHKEGRRTDIELSQLDTSAAVQADVEECIVTPSGETFKALVVPKTPLQGKQVKAYILSKMILKKADSNASYQATTTEPSAGYGSYRSTRDNYNRSNTGRYR